MPLVLPPVGQQDPVCWGAVGAWANQYALTANHYITNKYPPPIKTLSTQWMLDCYGGTVPYGCRLGYGGDWMVRQYLLMEDEYRGPVTGKPGQCVQSLASDNVSQSNNRPYGTRYDLPNYSDSAVEIGVQQGVVVSCFWINKKIV